LSPSKQQPTGNRSGRAKSSNRPNGKEKAQGKADKASSGKGSVKGVKGAAGEEKLDNVQLLHSTEIREEIESLMQRAAELDASADAVGARDSFEHRLGSALLAQTKPLPELVREWDKNGDGDINTIELRACVRNSLGIKAENKEIDAWFTKVDADGGGSLDLSELKSSFKKLKDMLLAGKAEMAALRKEAEAVRTQVELVDEVARATEEYEVSSSLLTQLVERPTVEARLSTAMAKRNMKIGDVASHWDKDHDGMVSKAEFRSVVMEMVPTAAVPEIDELFDDYDNEGSGNLSIVALKPQLKRLSELAHNLTLEIKKLRNKVTELHIAAAKPQRLHAQAKEEAAAEAKAKGEKAAQEAAEKAVEKAEAVRQRKEAKEAAAAAKAAEQAAYEAKIAARRQASQARANGEKMDAAAMWQESGAAVLAMGDHEH